MRQIIIILREGETEQILPGLARHATILHRLPPRLVIAALDEDQPGQDSLAELRSLTGVAAALDEQQVTPPDLTPAEELFIAAWRRRREPKVRPGDGADWDRAPFLPPDLPPAPPDLPPAPPGHG